jgi:hypothetical protein
MIIHLGLEITSGSKDKITDEEERTSKHCKWTDSEEDDQPAAVDEESDDHEEY